MFSSRRPSLRTAALWAMGALAFCGTVATASSARAQVGPAEIATHRQELSRLNTEIATLKRKSRSLREDLRLRALMADAEAVARLLTEAEARLRRPTFPGPPVVADVESAAVLEAKADILDDQAQRLAAQAARYTRAGDEIASRRRLRQRADRLEADPFFGVEGSKRSMMVTVPRKPEAEKATTATSAPPAISGGRVVASQPTEQPDPGLARSAPPTAGLAPSVATGAPSAPGSPSAPSVGPPPMAPAPLPSAPAADNVAGKGAGVPESFSPPPAGPPLPPAPPPTAALPAGLASQQRALLDPALAAELRHLESLSASGDPAAYARAAQLLRARAAQLEAAAKNLRTRAQTP